MKIPFNINTKVAAETAIEVFKSFEIIRPVDDRAYNGILSPSRRYQGEKRVYY